jgi:hypothetical protein
VAVRKRQTCPTQLRRRLRRRRNTADHALCAGGLHHCNDPPVDKHQTLAAFNLLKYAGFGAQQYRHSSGTFRSSGLVQDESVVAIEQDVARLARDSANSPASERAVAASPFDRKARRDE